MTRNQFAPLTLTGVLTMSFAGADELTTRQAFAEALISGERAADIRAEDDIYAPLLGRWDVETRDILPDGSALSGRGEWIFVRVLEGRAIQDVWILPARSTGAPRAPHARSRYGATLRMLDPRTRRWRITWFNPISGAFDVLYARVDGDRIVHEGEREGGQQIRWIIDRITPNNFRWYGEALQADGSWSLEAEFTGRRAMP
jgi:hypothetical protein